MPWLFSYGTLQDEDVQWSTFGRRLIGQRDELPGFERSLVKIDDPQVAAASGRTHHANVTFTGRDDSRVTGTALEITDDELGAADEYRTARQLRPDCGHARIGAGGLALRRWALQSAGVVSRQRGPANRTICTNCTAGGF